MNAKEMLEELLDAMLRDTVIKVLADGLHAEDIPRLSNQRPQ